MIEIARPTRMVAVALTASLGLTGCGLLKRTDHYIQNALPPHNYHNSIPENKAFPPDVVIQFGDGTGEYTASEDEAARTGLYNVLAFCGNPIDKRDPLNLYASMTVRSEEGEKWQVLAGIKHAPACADSVISKDDRINL